MDKRITARVLADFVELAGDALAQPGARPAGANSPPWLRRSHIGQIALPTGAGSRYFPRGAEPISGAQI